MEFMVPKNYWIFFWRFYFQTELCELQRLVFGSPLNDKGYEDIKSLILNNHNRGFTKRGIERDGFILLQAKLCSNLKQEVVWKMLKGLNLTVKGIIVILILARTQ